jgi:hypothetical protein
MKALAERAVGLDRQVESLDRQVESLTKQVEQLEAENRRLVASSADPIRSPAIGASDLWVAGEIRQQLERAQSGLQSVPALSAAEQRLAVDVARLELERAQFDRVKQTRTMNAEEQQRLDHEISVAASRRLLHNEAAVRHIHLTHHYSTEPLHDPSRYINIRLITDSSPKQFKHYVALPTKPSPHCSLL